MGIFPIPQSIPFVLILIPISSHSPISCTLGVVRTYYSFIIQETGCFTSQRIFRKASVLVKLFLQVWKVGESQCFRTALWSPGITAAHVPIQKFWFWKHALWHTSILCKQQKRFVFIIVKNKKPAGTISVTTWRAATKQKCHPVVKIWRRLVWSCNTASETKRKKDDVADFLHSASIFSYPFS